MGETAFVLSGGGSHGAVQVGMILALAEHGILPDLIVGTSVGAVNAAWIAGWPGKKGADKLADVWKTVRRNDIFPFRPLTGFLGFAGRSNYLVDPSNFRSLLQRHLNYTNLEDAPIPVRVVATEFTTGQEVVIASGEAVEAVAASAAIPGVFPPVVIGGKRLVDGGIANNTPISHAASAGATTIYVLPTGYACSLRSLPKGALAMALQAISLLTHQRLVADIFRYQDTVDLRILPGLCPLNVSPLDFSHTPNLIEQAYIGTSKWLASSDSEAGFVVEDLMLHGHSGHM